MTTLLAGAGTAQQKPPGSRNLPIDHWAYEYVKRLRSRGHLSNLNPTVQPYRRHEVARGLVQLDPDTLAAPVADWVRLLRREFQREIDRIQGREIHDWGVRATSGFNASSGQRLDPLRPIGGPDAWYRQTHGGWAETGAFAAETRLEINEWLGADPEGIDPGVGRIGRSDNSYFSVTLPFGNVAFGKTEQNWSTMGTTGLMVSGVPTTYPRLAFEFHVGHFTLRSQMGELETLTSPRTQIDLKRYISAHRLDYETDNLVLSFGEATLYGTTSGLQMRFLNPFEVLFATRNAPPTDRLENVGLNAQGWFRWQAWEFFGEFFLDDIDVDPNPQGAEPFTYAFSLGTRWTPPVVWLEFGATYEQVSAFAYRAPDGADVWSYLDRGLGAGFSDFDRLTVTADVFPPIVGLRLTPTIQLQRQGEGDLRDPVPPPAIHLASPALFLGQKETTYRLGLRGRYQPTRFFWVAWDVGQDFIRDANHLPGVDVNGFEATAAAAFTMDLPFPKGR